MRNLGERKPKFTRYRRRAGGEAKTLDAGGADRVRHFG